MSALQTTYIYASSDLKPMLQNWVQNDTIPMYPSTL